MTMGVIILTILAIFEGVQLAQMTLVQESLPSFLFAVTGIAALCSSSYRVRMLNFAVWGTMAGILFFYSLKFLYDMN